MIYIYIYIYLFIVEKINDQIKITKTKCEQNENTLKNRD